MYWGLCVFEDYWNGNITESAIDIPRLSFVSESWIVNQPDCKIIVEQTCL